MSFVVLVAKLFHESNGFNPEPTSESDFEISIGDDVLTGARTSGTTLGGIVKFLDTQDVSLAPVISVNGSPSGPVDHTFFLKVQSLLIEKIAELQPDAIALELHGAMATDKTKDAEGDLLRSLRKSCKEGAVIGVGLDLHAHITPLMLENADICIACKENPHSDVVDCGERVGALVLDVLHGKLSPVTVMAKTRHILPGKMETGTGPLFDMHRRARELADQHKSVRDISLYNVFRFIDAEDIGSAAVILTDKDPSIALPIADEFANTFWDRREEFVDDLVSLNNAMRKVADEKDADGLPVVIADMGDRTLAGAPGDSNAILKTALENAHFITGAIPMTDPESVAIAVDAGIGKTVDVLVGGKKTPGFSPLRVRGRVLSTSDGVYHVKGPYQEGETVSLGQTAVIHVNDTNLRLLLHSKPGFTHDPNAFESQGIVVAEQDFIVVKSGYHFTMNFEGLGTPLFVATPGVSYYTPGGMPRNFGKFWPEHDVSDDPIISPEIYRPRP